MMLSVLWARVWPYIAIVAAALAAVFGIRQSGKSAARTEAAAAINKHAAKARKEAQHVHNETARMDDDAIARELKSDWVRNSAERKH